MRLYIQCSVCDGTGTCFAAYEYDCTACVDGAILTDLGKDFERLLTSVVKKELTIFNFCCDGGMGDEGVDGGNCPKCYGYGQTKSQFGVELSHLVHTVLSERAQNIAERL